MSHKPTIPTIWLIVVYLLVCFCAGFYYFTNQ